jgi:multiple sugar transport system ATP-binding protein
MADVIIKKLSKYFGDHAVIDNLDLEIKNGEFVTLLGPSGCGKTTLLRMIAGLEKVDKGEILINDKRYNDIPAQYRHVAMVFQSYALFPHMSVYSNIRFGLKIKKVERKKAEEKIFWAISLLGLSGLERRLPKEISGGQRQRVALARALVLDPEVLLLDEPLSNLDTALRETAMEELKRIHRHVGTTIIYVSHNQTEAMTLSQRIAVLNGGRLEQYDTPAMVYDFPRTLFAAEFIGSPTMNFFDGCIVSQDNISGVNTGAGFIRFDKQIETGISKLDIKDVRVGIRPQNIAFAGRYSARRSSDTTIHLIVELVQSFGDRSLVVGKTQNGQIMRFLVSSEDEIKPDQAVDVFIDGRKIHLFDKQNRNVLSN